MLSVVVVQVQEEGVFIHGRLTRHHSVAPPPRLLTFRRLGQQVQTEKQQVLFLKNIGQIEGRKKKVLSSDRRRCSRPVWVSSLKSCSSLICVH